MIIGWIIQPQINKVEKQAKDLNSLRVDIRVENYLIRQELIKKQHERNKKEYNKALLAIKELAKLLQAIGSLPPYSRFKYPEGGYKGFKDNPL